MLASRDLSLEAAGKMDTQVSSGEEKELHPMETTRKSKRQRRFSGEQIRLLESMFKMESRPELQIKHQLADKLGLHPRQVAIWFQNKRARSKSRLIEQEYNELKDQYDTLASNLDLLKEENHSLLVQLNRLRNLMRKPQGSRHHMAQQTQKSIDEKFEPEKKANHLMKMQPKESECFAEETQFLNTEELVPDDSLISSRNLSPVEANFVLDHLCCSSSN